MSTFIEDKIKEIQDRIAALEPQVTEYNKLKAAEVALSSANAPVQPKRRPGRPRKNS